MRSAACVLILDEERTHVLAISRYKNTQDWGLPGGHVEPEDGGDLHSAAVRELKEETGIVVAPINLYPIYTARARTCLCTTFTIHGPPIHWPKNLRSRPFEGYVRWQPLEVLTSPHATFRLYTKRLFRHIGLLV